MRKKGNIVRYTAEDLAAMRARGESRTDWARVNAKTEEEIAADTKGDPAWDGIPEDWVARAQMATSFMTRPRENKRQVTMRFDPDVLAFFRGGGRGWQGRMNAVLRSYMERQAAPPTASRASRSASG